MDPFTLLAIFAGASSAIGGIGSLLQGRKSKRYYEDYLQMLNQNKSDMRKSLQARQNAYLGLEDIVFGRQISNPPTWSEGSSISSGNGSTDYNLNKSFRR